MSAEIRIFPHVSEMAMAVADRVVVLVRAAAHAGRPCILGWPAGRTPLPVLAALAERAGAGEVDLSTTAFAMMDEYLHRDADGWRLAPTAAHYSCRGFAQREIADRLNAVLPARRRLRSDGIWLVDPHEPGGYDQRLAAAGGVRLFLVAVGATDGHVAFNPPGTAADSRTRVIALADSTRRDNLATFPEFATLEQVPTHGVSVGLATMSDASELAVVAHGTGKRAAVRRTLAATGFDPQWPASFVHSHPQHTFYLDRAAVDVGTREGACAAS